MLKFENLNPITIMIYYLAVVTVSMFTMNPVLHAIAFTGGILQFCFTVPGKKGRSHLFYLLTGLILAFIRPVFSHNGATVLFVVNDNPITKESFIFGANAAVMVVGVLYLFRVFSDVMTSDRLLYLFGRFSPKTALVLSMGLRYIPRLRRQHRLIAQAQTATGINKDDNAIDRMKAGLNVFWATVGWGLENGIITADSMAARGYGQGRRTQFSLFRYKITDAVLTVIFVILMIPVVTALATGEYDTVFYPLFSVSKPGPAGTAGYICYGILLLIPLIIKISENIRWKYLMSKI